MSSRSSAILIRAYDASLAGRYGRSSNIFLRDFRSVYTTAIILISRLEETCKETGYSPIRLFDVADDCLPTVVDVDVLDADKLLTSISQTAQNFPLNAIQKVSDPEQGQGRLTCTIKNNDARSCARSIIALRSTAGPC